MEVHFLPFLLLHSRISVAYKIAGRRQNHKYPAFIMIEGASKTKAIPSALVKNKDGVVCCDL